MLFRSCLASSGSFEDEVTKSKFAGDTFFYKVTFAAIVSWSIIHYTIALIYLILQDIKFHVNLPFNIFNIFMSKILCDEMCRLIKMVERKRT